VKILEIVKRRTAEQAWVYRAKGVVWRVVPTSSGVLVGEDRKLDTKRTTFFCLNKTTGEVLWDGISFDEHWWIGIEAAHKDLVFLHGFSKPDMPDHLKIIALDVLTGRILWSSDDLRFILAVDDSIFASRDTISGRMIHELDLRTGAALRSWENDSEALRLAKFRLRSMTDHEYEFPAPLKEHPVTDEPASSLIYNYCKREDVVGPIEALEREDFLFFSYHERLSPINSVEGHLRNQLNVVDMKDVNLVFSETLNRNVPAVVPDSFFVDSERLYFVKDRSSLTALNISKLKR